MSYRNTAVTKTYLAWDVVNQTGKTGDGANHTLRVVTDGTEATPSSPSITEVDSTNCPGLYKCSLTAGENDAGDMTLHGKSSTANIIIIPVRWQNEVDANVKQYGGTAGTFSAGRPEVNTTHMVGGDLTGNNANVKLKSLDVTNSAGDALKLASSAGGGHGLNVTASNGDAASFAASGGSGNGIAASGNGTGSGISATGGATGNGITGTGGATSGDGVAGKGGGFGSGISGSGVGTGTAGVFAFGASGNAHGFKGTANGSGHGIFGVADTTGDGIRGNNNAGSGVDIRGNLTGNITGTLSALGSGAVQSIWDALTSALTTAGSIGKALVALVAAVISYPVTTGTVQTDGGNSATQFKTDLTQSSDDYWKTPVLVVLTSGVLAGQSKRIASYNGTTKIITVDDAFTGTPADGVTFSIVNR